MFQKKIYAITRGRQLGVYDDFMIVDRFTAGYKGASYICISFPSMRRGKNSDKK